MSLYITFLQPAWVTRIQSEKETLEQMADVYTDGHLVSNTTVMAQLCRSMCALHQQKIKGIVFASHGTPTSFYIGRDWITMDLLNGVSNHPQKRHIIPALRSLRPFFAPSAWIRIQACECGANKDFIRKLSQIMGVAVLAWTGSLYVELENDKGTGFSGGGNEVICLNRMCNEF